MKVPLNWLASYVTIAKPVRELAAQLTMAGLEVEKVERAGGAWQGIIVGQLLSVVKHPNADHLFVTSVNTGADAPSTIVCGADNIAAGQLVPVAGPGTSVGDLTIQRRKIRGIVSEGMLCSPKELGMSDDHSGILILDGSPAIGSPLADALGGPILDIEVTPNRPDCLSVRGVAREVAALLQQPLRLPEPAVSEAPSPHVSAIASVEVLDADLCPRYAARVVKSVSVAPSPAWLRNRLESAGVRSISNVVDVSNYVMLEFGQPLHFFDYDLLAGHHIEVRRARTGETITTLDGTERPLDASMLAICDRDKAIAVAGVMGGLHSEVTDSTTTILIEAASFNPASIRRTSRALNLRSEASTRFERGIDPAYVRPAIDRAAELLAELAGGVVVPGVIDAYPAPEPVKTLKLTMNDIERTLGISYPAASVERILVALGYGLQASGTQSWSVTVPSFRRDVALVPDLVEDLARIAGYDGIPATLPATAPPETTRNEWLLFESSVRAAALRCGLDETVAYPLTSKASMERLLVAGQEAGAGHEDAVLPSLQPGGLERAIGSALALRNPLSPEWSVLRPTLLDSALKSLSLNAKTSDQGVRIFEIGRAYLADGDGDRQLPIERRVLSVAMTGAASAGSWQDARRDVDFWDLRGSVDAILNSLAVAHVVWKPGEHRTLHPGRTAWLWISNRVIGVAGEVHPQCVGAYELTGRAYVAEIDLQALTATALTSGYVPSRFPAVYIDMALIAPKTLTFATVAQALREEAGPLCTAIRLFDVYDGTPIADGQHSLGFTLTFQSDTRTLTIDEVSQVRSRIASALAERLAVTLRDG